MAREILFKAKRKDNSEWIEGSLIISGEYACILKKDDGEWDYPYLNANTGTFDGEATPILSETICQYTGLNDKNGDKIWENDIANIFSRDYCGLNKNGVVVFHEGAYCVKYEQRYGSIIDSIYHRIGKIGKWQDMSASGIMNYTYARLGDIFDNPGLLEGGAE